MSFDINQYRVAQNAFVGAFSHTVYPTYLLVNGIAHMFAADGSGFTFDSQVVGLAQQISQWANPQSHAFLIIGHADSMFDHRSHTGFV